MHYRIYIAETPLPRRGPSPRGGFVEGVDRANVSIIQSVAHLDTWTGGGGGSKSGFDRSQRHVTTRATALHISWSARSNDPPFRDSSMTG